MCVCVCVCAHASVSMCVRGECMSRPSHASEPGALGGINLTGQYESAELHTNTNGHREKLNVCVCVCVIWH